MAMKPVDWQRIALVVFDVDGTLYDQGALRLRMVKDLVGDALSSRSLVTVRVLRRYRALRELFAEREMRGFDDALLSRVAGEMSLDEARVRALVSEWILLRPLVHLGACRYPHVSQLFAALRRRHKTIGIFSDYPAAEKLRAMHLEADIIVCATDDNVGILKPDPRGLLAVMDAAGVGPDQTLMIGDRAERDGEAARRAGAAALIRSRRPVGEFASFATYRDAPFDLL